MRILLQVIGIIVLVYLLLVLVFWMTGICPEYIDKMPKIIEPGSSYKEVSFPEVLHGLKLCPFSEVVY